jgi:hypothetical protein
MEAMEKDVSGIAEGWGKRAEGRGAKRAKTRDARKRLLRVGEVREVGRKTTTLGAELKFHNYGNDYQHQTVNCFSVRFSSVMTSR